MTKEEIEGRLGDYASDLFDLLQKYEIEIEEVESWEELIELLEGNYETVQEETEHELCTAHSLLSAVEQAVEIINAYEGQGKNDE